MDIARSTFVKQEFWRYTRHIVYKNGSRQTGFLSRMTYRILYQQNFRPHFCPRIHRCSSVAVSAHRRAQTLQQRRKLTVAALLSRIKELTKHDNHDSHKSHNRCEKSDGRTGWTKRGEKASRRIEISTELNKYYFDNRQAKRARLSVIRPRGCRLLRNYKGIMRPGILRARCNRPRITGRRNNREHSCNLSTSIETRTRARYNYESFAPLAMLGGRMESNEGARWLKGFFLRGRNEDHAFTLQAFRDVAIINRIMLPRETAERATLPQSFASRPHFAIVT